VGNVEPDKNNHGFQGLERSIGHWITDGSATKRDSAELRKWGDLPKKLWAGGAPTAFPVTLKHKDKALVMPRSNAVYVSSQRFNIGDDVGIWRRIEVSPYPRVANVKENQSLIDAGYPSFEVDPNYVMVADSMDRETRGKHMRYLVDRAIAILKDPKAANPPTVKHAEAKELLERVAGDDANVTATTTEEEAGMDLDKLMDIFVHACEPKGMEADNSELDVTERRKQFQKKGPRCFCPKKPAPKACKFRIIDLAALLKEHAQPSTYTHFMPRVDHVGKLTGAVQLRLGLDVGPTTQAYGIQRGTIFGFTLDEDVPATSTDDDDENGPKRKKGCAPAKEPVSKKQKA
jgi:hypothetical protein